MVQLLQPNKKKRPHWKPHQAHSRHNDCRVGRWCRGVCGALVASTQLRCDSNNSSSSNNNNSSSSNNNKHSGAHGVVVMAQLPLSSQQQASQDKPLWVHSTSTTTTRTDRSIETRFMRTNETKGNHKWLMLNGIIFKSTMMKAAVQASLRKNYYNARTDTSCTSSGNHSCNAPLTQGWWTFEQRLSSRPVVCQKVPLSSTFSDT